MARKKTKITIKMQETEQEKAKRRRRSARKAGEMVHKPTRAHEPKTRYRRSRAKQQLRKQLQKEG